MKDDPAERGPGSLPLVSTGKCSLEPCSHEIKDLAFLCSQLLGKGSTDAQTCRRNWGGVDCPPSHLALTNTPQNPARAPSLHLGATCELWFPMNSPILLIFLPEFGPQASLRRSVQVSLLVPGVDSLLWVPQILPPTYTLVSPPGGGRGHCSQNRGKPMEMQTYVIVSMERAIFKSTWINSKLNPGSSGFLSTSHPFSLCSAFR